jgi:hypothetical protein
MKYILLLLIIPSCAFSQARPQDQKPQLLAPIFTKMKCDKTHHILNSIALTYPPCYDCVCGRHLWFDLKTYMALDIKYGDSLDRVISRYMKSGDWYKGINIIDSSETERLAGKRYKQYQKSIDSIFKTATTTTANPIHHFNHTYDLYP